MPSETPEEFEAHEDERLEAIAEIIVVSQELEEAMIKSLDQIKSSITTHRQLLTQLVNLVDGS